MRVKTWRSAVSRSVRRAMTERSSRTNQRETSGDWRPVTYTFGRLFVKRFALCYQTVVCLSVCPVCNVGVLWPNGWMDQDKTWLAGRPCPWPHRAVRWEPSSTPQRGIAPPPIFGPCLLWPDGRPSQLLLRTCIFIVADLPFYRWCAILFVMALFAVIYGRRVE